MTSKATCTPRQSREPLDPNVLNTEEYRLDLGGARRYDPDAGASAGEGAHMSMLVDNSTGDWSWKPARDKALGPNLVTFTGNAPGAAESFGRTTYHVR